MSDHAATAGNTGETIVKKPQRYKKIKRYRINMTLKQFKKYVSIMQTNGAEMMRVEMEADEKTKEHNDSNVVSVVQSSTKGKDDDVNKTADVRGSLTSRSKSNVTAADDSKALANVISYKQQQQTQQFQQHKVAAEPPASKTKGVVWKILKSQTDVGTAASNSSSVIQDARQDPPPCTPRHTRCVACTYKKLFPDREDTQLSLQERQKSADNIFVLSQADAEDWIHNEHSCFAELFASSRPKSDPPVTYRNKQNRLAGKIVAKEAKTQQEQSSETFNMKPKVSDTLPTFSKITKPDHSHSAAKPAPNVTTSLPLPTLTKNSVKTSLISTSTGLTDTKKNTGIESSRREATFPPLATNKVGLPGGGIIKSKSLIQLPALNGHETTKSDTTFEKQAKRTLNPPLTVGRHQKLGGDTKRWMFTNSPTPVRVFLSFYEVPQEKYIDGITDEHGRPLLPVSRQHILRGMIYDKVNKSLYPPLPNTPKRKGLRMANLMNRTVNKAKRKREKSDKAENERANSAVPFKEHEHGAVKSSSNSHGFLGRRSSISRSKRAGDRSLHHRAIVSSMGKSSHSLNQSLQALLL